MGTTLPPSSHADEKKKHSTAFDNERKIPELQQLSLLKCHMVLILSVQFRELLNNFLALTVNTYKFAAKVWPHQLLSIVSFGL